MERSILCLGLGPEGLEVVVAAGARAPAVGRLVYGAADVLRAQAAALRPSAGLLVPSEDVEMAAAERGIGRGLAAMLAGPGLEDVAAAIGAARSRAHASGRRLSLLVDARTPTLRALPWELLELAPADGGPAAGAHVARLGPGPAWGGGAADRIAVSLWVPVEDDPVCARVAAGLRARLAGLRRVTLGPAPGALHVVHVVCHGRLVGGETLLAFAPGRHLDAAAAAAVLRPQLAGATLAVLDVCGGSAFSADAAAAPASRVVEAGVPACLAPRSPLDAEAALAASAALYASLDAGRPLDDAVDAARRALAGLGIGHPSFRWWSPLLTVSDGDVLDAALSASAVERPAELRHAGPAAAALLDAALRLGRVQGFLGVEHVALAMARAPSPSATLALVQDPLATLAADVAAWVPGGGPLRVSPRLADALRALPAGFDDDDLLRAVARLRPWRRALPALGALAVGPAPATLHSLDAFVLAEPGETLELEVVGGPEDGRVLSMGPDHPLLGRHAPGRAEPAVELFVDAPTDPAVSRRHLAWGGGGRLTALGPVTLTRGRKTREVEGEVVVRPGDVLSIGLATHLEVLRVPS